MTGPERMRLEGTWHVAAYVSKALQLSSGAKARARGTKTAVTSSSSNSSARSSAARPPLRSCAGATRSASRTRRGVPCFAMTTAAAISPTEATAGATIDAGEASEPSACSRVSSSSAITSSSTAEAMISWPTGVLSASAARSTLSAMPMEEGASVHPAARLARGSSLPGGSRRSKVAFSRALLQPWRGHARLNTSRLGGGAHAA